MTSLAEAGDAMNGCKALRSAASNGCDTLPGVIARTSFALLTRGGQWATRDTRKNERIQFGSIYRYLLRCKVKNCRSKITRPSVTVCGGK